LKMAPWSMERATIIRPGSARSGTATRTRGAMAGGRAGLRGTVGVLNSASVGVGVTGGDAIPGGARTTITAWLPQEGVFPRARHAVFTRGDKGQIEPNISRGQNRGPVMRALTIRALARWRLASEQVCRMCLIGHHRASLEPEPIGRSLGGDIRVARAQRQPPTGMAPVLAAIVPMEQIFRVGIIRLD
jgi:hypothetical protein